MTPEQRRSRKTLFSLVLIFCLPMLIAYVVFHWRIPLGHSTNRGELRFDLPTIPSLDIKALNGNSLASNHRWTILYLPPTVCDQRCRKNLFLIHQIDTALRDDKQRIQKWVIVADAQYDSSTASIHSDENNRVNANFQKLGDLAQKYTLPIGIYNPTIQTQTTQIQITSKNQTLQKTALQTGFLYLADPNGNLILAYSPRMGVDDLFTDLQHLLKNSQIG